MTILHISGTNFLSAPTVTAYQMMQPKKADPSRIRWTDLSQPIYLIPSARGDGIVRPAPLSSTGCREGFLPVSGDKVVTCYGRYLNGFSTTSARA